jgi:hypothetical protein
MEKKEKDWKWLAYVMLGFSYLIIIAAAIFVGVHIFKFLMDTTP